MEVINVKYPDKNSLDDINPNYVPQPIVSNEQTTRPKIAPIEAQATSYLNEDSSNLDKNLVNVADQNSGISNAQAKLKASPEAAAAFGWTPSPLIQNYNIENAKQHMIESQPKVAAVMKAAQPNATPDDRLKAADIFKSTSEARPEDVIRAVVNLNPGDLYIALTGGSDRREIAIDANGKQYWKVYNARVSATNPAGELRRVEDFVTHQPLTSEQMDQVGPLTSRSDITAERQAKFIAQGQNFKDVAAANSANYINLQKSSSAAAIHGTGITDLADQANELGKKLGKYSLPPAVLQQLIGINSIRTGNTDAIKKAKEGLNQFSTGDKTNDDWKNFVDTNGGVNFGLQYKQGEGYSYGGSKIKSTDELNRIVNNYEQSQSSTQAIDRRRDDMINAALIRATEIDPANRQQALIDITQFINKNAQIAQMQNDIEKSGGVPGVKPNLPHALGESYQAGTLKAISDRAYGETANLWAQFINNKRSQLAPGAVPPMGQWEAEFANSPEVKGIKAKAKAESLSYMQDAQAEMKAQSLAPVTAGTPGADKQNAVIPPAISGQSNTSIKDANAPPVKTQKSEQSKNTSSYLTPVEFEKQTNADKSLSEADKKSQIERYRKGYSAAVAEEQQKNKSKPPLSDIIKKK